MKWYFTKPRKANWASEMLKGDCDGNNADLFWIVGVEKIVEGVVARSLT